MKAFVYEKYGPPETLRIAEVEKRAPDPNEVLVKVLAVSVNPADWHSMRGKPLFSRATIEAGKVRPHIDRRYAFTDIPSAIAYLEQGHARGKVVAGVP